MMIEIRTPWGTFTEPISADTVGALISQILTHYGKTRDDTKIYHIIKSDGEILEDGKSHKVYSWKPADYAILVVTDKRKVQVKK